MKPRVFEEGTITLVFNQGDCSLFAGAQEVASFERISVSCSEPDLKPELIITFNDESKDEADMIKIEEAKRTLRTIKWVTIN